MKKASAILRRFAPMALAALCAACATPATIFVSPQYNPSSVRTVAVLGFSDYPGAPGSGQMVSQIFEPYLLTLGYNVVERQQVQSVLQEQSFDLSGAVDMATTQQVGKLLGADALIMGSLTYFTDTSQQTVLVDMPQEHARPIFGPVGKKGEVGIVGMNTWQTNNVVPQTQTTPAQVGISVRMVSVKTGSILWTGTVSSTGSDLNAAAQNASQSLIEALAKKLGIKPADR
ncbi:MAG: hypothetical protein KGL04_11110 [Elusimicrobia bacterium]|nr:hypothetical protein [Elusimicrobiota bacterium]